MIQDWVARGDSGTSTKVEDAEKAFSKMHSHIHILEKIQFQGRNRSRERKEWFLEEFGQSIHGVVVEPGAGAERGCVVS